MESLTLQLLPQDFTVCQLPPETLPDISAPFCFYGRTDEESSLVCPADSVPAAALCREDGWRALRICGTLDFSLIGILARITALLAGEKIGVFVLSTYNTDYVLVKEARLADALEALRSADYHLIV